MLKKTKQEPTLCCLQEIHLSFKETKTENKGVEKDITGKQKVKNSRGSQTCIKQNRL